MDKRIIEIDFNDLLNQESNVEEILKNNIVIVRNCELIRLFRKNLIACIPKMYQSEIQTFYKHLIVPSHNAIYHLRNVLELTRDLKYLSTLLYEFIVHIFRAKSILVDGGISRLLFPEREYRKLKESFLFSKQDFQRTRGSSNVETFMNGESNIHRDFNRICSVKMFNMWIPMHDISQDNVLCIYPEYLNDNIFNMDNTKENRSNLKNRAVYKLAFGDFVLFNSEQLHHSPLRDTSKTIRHSFDFRVILNDGSDGGHYRENFDNIHNFYIPMATSKSYKLKENIKDLADYQCNASMLSYKYRKGIITKEKLFEVYQELPFSEDRYIMLALSEIENSKFVKDVCMYVISKTNKYFWIYKLYKLSQYIGEENSALFNKALKLAKSNPLEFSRNLNYRQESKEIDYNFLLQTRAIKETLVIIAKNANINIDNILAKIGYAKAIVPVELEKYLTYVKNIDILSVYVNDLTFEQVKNYQDIYIVLSKSESENIKVYDYLRSSNIKQFKLLGINESSHLILDTYISPLATIEKTVNIGENVSIGDLVSIDDYTTIKNNINIGRCTGISTHVHIYNDCNIGKFCAIGANTVLAGPPHHIRTMSISNKLKFKNHKPFKNYTQIGNDVWIAANCTVKANITIGDGAVIGANSFVNSDIPPYSIVVGSPAKVISYRFSKSIRKKLLKLKWWNIDDVTEYVFDADIENSLLELSKLKKYK